MTEQITIAILGAGNIGGTLGQAWIAAGHQVAFGVRDPRSQKVQAYQKETGTTAKIGSVSEALAGNPDVVVLAVPGTAMDETIIAHARQLDGRLIIDAANRPGGGPANSLATLQEQTPHARVYRAFNSLGWENLAHPQFAGVPADLFYCGPDGETRTALEQLIAEVGLRPIWVGGNEQVSLVDSVARLWITLAFGQQRGRHLAFKLLSD